MKNRTEPTTHAEHLAGRRRNLTFMLKYRRQSLRAAITHGWPTSELEQEIADMERERANLNEKD